jgi:hypothetical protein
LCGKVSPVSPAGDTAYIVSRGLAKAGSSEPYWADPGDLPRGQTDE